VWRWVILWYLLWVISFGGHLCYLGLFSSSLALFIFLALGLIRCLGCMSFRAEPFPFLFDCCLHYLLSFVLLIVRWISMGRLILFRDRSWSLAAILFGWLWYSLVDRGEGCPYDLVLKSGGSVTFDSRSGVSSLAEVWGFLWCSFDGSVKGWWKLNDLSNRSFMDVAQLW
jgi:hypothetical protein